MQSANCTENSRNLQDDAPLDGPLCTLHFAMSLSDGLLPGLFFDNCLGKQGNHDFMVAREGDAASAD